MDNRFLVPRTSISFDLNFILGLISGVGDTATLLVTLHPIEETKRYNLPHCMRVRIYWNTFIDWLIGFIPFPGDIFDIGWNANYEMPLNRKYLEERT